MVIAEPATVNVPVRSAPVFVATVNWTVPAPLPLEPAEIVKKLAPLVAVQVHAVPEVTLTATDPEPPSGPNVDVAG
jgi:hypothetical protein